MAAVVLSLSPVVMVQEAANDDATIAFLLSQALSAEKEVKEVEELVADLARKERRLREELEMLRTSPARGARGSPVEVAAAWWSTAKTALVKREITDSPGWYTNTGRAAPCAPAARVPAVLHDPGGAPDPVHRQTL